jgi:ubiquinone/menaquinone biosynthesis C-methylase UbiE
MTITSAPGNLDQARAWDGDEGDHWTVQEQRYNAASRRFDPYLFTAASLASGERVLDIGCGCGVSTRQAARMTETGAVLGVDLSRRMIQRARERAREEGLDNVTFEQADAQTHRFQHDAYDVVISRFGSMFFADPVTAFRNVHPALSTGGRLALLTWQPLERNGPRRPERSRRRQVLAAATSKSSGTIRSERPSVRSRGDGGQRLQ